jgi:hypothetical protein
MRSKKNRKNRKNRKYTKKGGIFFTRTSKYKDIKNQKIELTERVKALEEELRMCQTETEQCYKNLSQTQFRNPIPTQKLVGGLFGLTSSSKYHSVKSEKENLEQRIIELQNAIEVCRQEKQQCKDKTTVVRNDKWNKSMDWVREEGARNTQKYIQKDSSGGKRTKRRT